MARAEPDAAAGRAVVVGGERSEVTPCFRCHGLEGVGDSAGAFPRLAGQAAFYMYKQLIDYASGARPSEVMAPIAREMTEPQMVDVAYYYSLQIAPSLWQPEVDPAVLARGETIAEDGLRDQGLQACNLCHGENGTGQPPLFPYLAGQYAAYTELQLLLEIGLRGGERRLGAGQLGDPQLQVGLGGGEGKLGVDVHQPGDRFLGFHFLVLDNQQLIHDALGQGGDITRRRPWLHPAGALKQRRAGLLHLGSRGQHRHHRHRSR